MALLREQARAGGAHGLLLGITQNNPPTIRVQDVFPVADDQRSLSDEIRLWRGSGGSGVSPIGYFADRRSESGWDASDLELLDTTLPEHILLAATLRLDSEDRLLARTYIRNADRHFECVPDHESRLEVDSASHSIVARLPGEPSRTGARWLQVGVGALVAGVLVLLYLYWTQTVSTKSSANQQQTRPAEAPPALDQPFTAPPAIQAELKQLPAPRFLLPTRPPKDLPGPPEVKIWYSPPEADSLRTSLKARQPKSRGAMLVEPFLESGTSH